MGSHNLLFGYRFLSCSDPKLNLGKVGPRGRLTIEAPIGVAQFIELIMIAGQALDRDPAVPVG